MRIPTRDEQREFMKDTLRLEIDFSQTDQSRRVPPPPLEAPCPQGVKLVKLCSPGSWQGIQPIELSQAIGLRESRRQFTDAALTLDELSYLLFATQGVRGKPNQPNVLRVVPSAGCRHAFETYLAIQRVDGLEPGIYRYLPLKHRLALLRPDANLQAALINGALGQMMVGLAAVTFIWAAEPYRMEWRYGLAAHRVMLIDVGHICQNLYLAVQAIGAGTCAVAAYNQEAMDELLALDGDQSYTVYLAPVGK